MSEIHKKRCLFPLIALCLLLSSCSGEYLPIRQENTSASLSCGNTSIQPVRLNTVVCKKSSTNQTFLETAQEPLQDLEQQPKQDFAPIELILQNPDLPNGCEVTSLAMVLTSAGFPVSHVALYRECMSSENFTYSENQRFGPSPEEYYVGNASSYTGGWYCFENPIVETGNIWLQKNGSKRRMQMISGITQAELDQYAQDKVPVVVWVTLEYAPPSYSTSFSWILPNGEQYVPYQNLHCVVLAGEENGQYLIADPIYGWQTVSKEIFWTSFDAMGRRAVTI